MNKLAPQLSNATWIQEASGRLPNLPKNAWNIGRKFLQGFYVLGALGALATKSNKVGRGCGVRLPDVITSENSVAEALHDVNPQAQRHYSWGGDFNDPAQARQTAETQTPAGAHVIVARVHL